MQTSTEGTTEQPDDGRKKMSILKRVSNGFISILETAFYKLGWMVGSHPVWTVFLCVLVSGLCSIGMKDLQPTSEAEKLWVPATSRVQWEKKWVQKHFPPVTRYASLIVTSDNILTPTSLQAMMRLFKEVEALKINGQNFTTMCFRVGPLCRATSILELWYNNEHLIKSLTQKDIVDRVNNVTHSPLYHGELDVTSFLGRIQRDNQGRIVRAQAASMLFLLLDKKEWRDAAMEWELDMVDIANKGQRGLQHVYIYTTRSLDDEVKGAVNSDFGLLSMGFSIVLIYLILTLGRFNLLQQKLYLSLAGLFSVGMAIGLAYGLAITCGVLYGPVHGMMPFLLLGIGVDDMFIIVESWKNLTPDEEKYPLPERIALTLKHAGVSVTVTSVTDVVAFAIGASTVIPGLSAFCTYAAIGILALYALQSTFFVACLTLDQMRQESLRDGCIVCYKHKDYVPNKCSQKNIMAFIFEKYLGPNLMKLPCKLLAVLITCVILGVNIWGFINLRQDFDLTDYIPSDSYAHAYANARENYFPSEGETVNVYCGAMAYHENVDKLNKMYDDITNDPYVVNGSVTFWFRSFSSWYDSIKDEEWVQPYLDKKTNYIYSRAKFSRLMWKFLYYTDVGQAYRHHAYFKNGTVIPELEGTYFSLRHTNQPNSKAEIVAMESLRKILDNVGFTPKCFSYTDVYLTYEANKVLQNELYRNLLLAGICVFVVTLLLIANIRTSLIVFTCVIFTVVDVAGTLYFWKVTIDTASSILLTLSVGLAVDYSAHVGHMFMTVSGTREERAVLTLKKIGPAVFSGGFSTFLAFVLLSRSYSYGFIVFFRVFVSVVVFGLFHGLIYLPVVLSWIGPDPYETKSHGKRRHLYVPDCNFTNGGPVNDNTECENKTNKDGNPSSPLVLGNSIMMDHMPHQEEPDHKANSPLLNSLKNSTTPLLNNEQQVAPQDNSHLLSNPSGNKLNGSSPRIQPDPSGDVYKESSPLDQTGSGEEQPFLPQAEKLESPWVFQGKVATSVPIFKFSNTDKTIKTLSKEPLGTTDHCQQDIPLNAEKDSTSGITENGNSPHQEVSILGNGRAHLQEGPVSATTMEKAKETSSPWELRDTVFTSEDIKLLDRSSKSQTER